MTEAALEEPGAGRGNSGLRLLDACFDDIGYARYLLHSKRAQDLEIRTKVNWKEYPSGNSILHFLVYSDLDQAVKLLLEHKADANIKNRVNESPLHWCAKTNATRCATLLILHKAQVNSTDIGRNTPLHYAVTCGNVEMVVLLLDRGADPSLRDHDGCSALDLAVEGKASLTGTMSAIATILVRHYHRHNLTIPPNTGKNVRAKKIDTSAAGNTPVKLVVTEPTQTANEVTSESNNNFTPFHGNDEPDSIAAYESEGFEDNGAVGDTTAVPRTTHNLRASMASLISELSQFTQGFHHHNNDATRLSFTSQSGDLSYAPEGYTYNQHQSPQRQHQPHRSKSVGVRTMLDLLHTGELSIPNHNPNSHNDTHYLHQQQAQQRPHSAHSGGRSLGSGNTQHHQGHVMSASQRRQQHNLTRRSLSRIPEQRDLPSPDGSSSRSQSPSHQQKSPKHFRRVSSASNISNASSSQEVSSTMVNISSHHHYPHAIKGSNQSPKAGSTPRSLEAFTALTSGKDGKPLNSSDKTSSTSAGATGGKSSSSITDASAFAAQQQFILAMMGADDAANAPASNSLLLPAEPSEEPVAANNNSRNNGGNNKSRAFSVSSEAGNSSGNNNANNNNSNNNNNSPAVNVNNPISSQKALLTSLLASLPQLEQLDASLQQLPSHAAGQLAQHWALQTQITSLQQQLKEQLQLLQQPGIPPKEAIGRLKIPHIPSSLKAQAAQLTQGHNGSATRKTGATSASTSNSTLTDNFAPAELIPFLPDAQGIFAAADDLGEFSPDHLDVVICVEHCFDCHLHNGQSLRHDTKKYVEQANLVLSSLVRVIAESRLGVRLYALRSRPLTEKRLGAFEVSVAVRLNLPAAPAATSMYSSNIGNRPGSSVNPLTRLALGAGPPGGNRDINLSSASLGGSMTPHGRPDDDEEDPQVAFLKRWASHTLHSKLATKSWPNIKQLETRCVAFLEQAIKEVVTARNFYNSGSGGGMAGGAMSAHTPSVYLTGHSNGQSTPLGHNPSGLHPALEYRHQTITHNLERTLSKQYMAWTERMRVPPVVERHHLDTDWPTLKLNSSDKDKSGAGILRDYLGKEKEVQHPQGPMIDVSLATQMRQALFEKAVLKHFFVFDARLISVQRHGYVVCNEVDEER